MTPRSIWTSLTKSSLRRQALGNYALKITNMGLTFAGSVVLARVLGPEQFGVYSFAYAVLMILAIVAEFGLPTLVVRETAKGMVRQEYSLVRGIWSWALKVSGGLSLILIIVGGFFLMQGKWLQGNRLEAVLWTLAILPLLVLGDIRNGALRGLGKIILGQIPEFLVRPLLHFGFVFVLWLNGIRIKGVVGIQLYLLAVGISFFLGLLLWYSQSPKKVLFAQSIYVDKNNWRYSVLHMGALDILATMNQNLPMILLGLFSVSNAEIGVFRIAQQFALLSMFGLGVNVVLAPKFVSLYEQKNHFGLQRVAVLGTRLIFTMYLTVAICFLIFGHQFIQILYGKEYVDAYRLALVMLGGQFAKSFVGPSNIILRMTGFESENTKALFISVVINMIMSLILIPSYGAFGVALAWASSSWILSFMFWRAIRKKVGIKILPLNVR